MTKSYIREKGPLVVANGYKVVAIRPNSKAPIGKAWQEHPLIEKERLVSVSFAGSEKIRFAAWISIAPTEELLRKFLISLDSRKLH